MSADDVDSLRLIPLILYIWYYVVAVCKWWCDFDLNDDANNDDDDDDNVCKFL